MSEKQLIERFKITTKDSVRNHILKEIYTNNYRICLRKLKRKYTDEVKQDLMITMFKALRTFDTSLDYKFSTYLLQYIKIMYGKKQDVEIGVFDDTYLSTQTFETESILSQNAEKYEIAEKYLTSKQRQMIKIYLSCDCNYRRMSERIEVTHQRCQQIMTRIFDDIRNYAENPPKTIEEEFKDIFNINFS
jgi:DNA-directed RNA polymerase specialized sigma subunit